jgi:O-antigen/teichoic acid export membrane protein
MAERVGAFFEDHRESKDLGRAALRSGVVSVAIQYGNAALQITAAIILARLLAPEDFGLVAIVTVLTSFAPLLIDFGLIDATAQRTTITPSQVSGLFWVSTGIGVGIAVVVAACGPLIASLYDEPRLQSIAWVTSMTFVALGVSNQHMALLRRAMRFGKIGQIQFLGTLAGIVVAVVLARRGYGYWALVLRPFTNAFCVAILAWTACRWRPGAPAFDDDVKSMLRFGLHVVGFTVAHTLSRAVDRIGLGLFYRPEQVGYFQNAVNLYENSIVSALSQTHNVGSIALRRLQSNPAALRKKYEVALSMLAFFAMPLSAILSVTAEDLTVILLGEKWRAAGALLTIIALKGIFNVVEGSQGWLHLAIGSADRWRNWGVVTFVVQSAAVLAGLSYGPSGVAIATVVANMLIALPSVTYAGRSIGIGAALVIRAVGPQFIGAVSASVLGWWMQSELLMDYSGFVRMIISGGFCACIYLAIVVGLFRRSEPIRAAGRVAKDLLWRR